MTSTTIFPGVGLHYRLPVIGVISFNQVRVSRLSAPGISLALPFVQGCLVQTASHLSGRWFDRAKARSGAKGLRRSSSMLGGTLPEATEWIVAKGSACRIVPATLLLATVASLACFQEAVKSMRISPRAGELCVVCNQPVHPGDKVYDVDGVRLPVHAGQCEHKLLANPRAYAVRAHARGGALLGSDLATPGASGIWLYAALYVLAGLVFGALSAHRAVQAGYRPLAGFAWGFLLNVVGYAVVLSRLRYQRQLPAEVPRGLRKVPVTHAPLTCPSCGASNHPSATYCPGCGVRLHPNISSEVERI
jgi:hypothetical protein